MSHVTVDCPECGCWFVVNGRGRCRCGAYLIDHADKSFAIPERAYIRRDGKWVPIP